MHCHFRIAAALKVTNAHQSVENLELPAGFMISLPIMKSTVWQESCWATFYCTSRLIIQRHIMVHFFVSWPRLRIRITTAVKVQINFAKFTLQRRYKPETSKGNINVTTFILQHYNNCNILSSFTHYLIVFFNFSFFIFFSFSFLICIFCQNCQDFYFYFSSCGSKND